MASESKGRLAGFMRVLPDFAGVFLAEVPFTRMNGAGIVKRKHARG
jgi:hypothetical protein